MVDGDQDLHRGENADCKKLKLSRDKSMETVSEGFPADLRWITSESQLSTLCFALCCTPFSWQHSNPSHSFLAFTLYSLSLTLPTHTHKRIHTHSHALFSIPLINPRSLLIGISLCLCRSEAYWYFLSHTHTRRTILIQSHSMFTRKLVSSICNPVNRHMSARLFDGTQIFKIKLSKVSLL